MGWNQVHVIGIKDKGRTYDKRTHIDPNPPMITMMNKAA